jgi:hypothetical protein
MIQGPSTRNLIILGVIHVQGHQMMNTQYLTCVSIANLDIGITVLKIYNNFKECNEPVYRSRFSLPQPSACSAEEPRVAQSSRSTTAELAAFPEPMCTKSWIGTANTPLIPPLFIHIVGVVIAYLQPESDLSAFLIQTHGSKLGTTPFLNVSHLYSV